MIDQVLSGEGRWACVNADALAVLRTLPDQCADFVLTDVPYGLGNHEPTPAELLAYMQGGELDTGGDFMGSKWRVPSVKVWLEIFRCMKPGALCFSFAGSKTVDLIAMGMRMAGFERRDTLQWWYGQGNAKGIGSIGKAIDRADGAEREVVGIRKNNKADSGVQTYAALGAFKQTAFSDITSPASEESAEWEGHGTGLAPCYEPIIVCRKPIPGTVVENIREHGVGAYNIDGCRIATDWNEPDRPDSWKRSGHTADADASKIAAPPGNGITCNTKGRWPSNLLLSHSPDCVCVGTRTLERSVIESTGDLDRPCVMAGGGGGSKSLGTVEETIPSYRCAPSCPVAALDRQAGIRKSGAMAKSYKRESKVCYGEMGPTQYRTDANEGTASRFFKTFPPESEPTLYCPKASRAERELGCEHLPPVKREQVTGRQEGAAGQKNHLSGMTRQGEIRNHGKCVKPINVTRWLARLGGRPGGLCLVPYCGTGSEMIGALLEGMRVIGVELDASMLPIASARIAWWQAHPGGITQAAKEEAKLEAKGQVRLFG